jgi:hypothetical protein
MQNMKYSLLIVTLLLFVAGCSNNAGVSGKVQYDDGTPVDHGMVVFTETNVVKADGSSGGNKAGTRNFRGVIKNGRYNIGVTGKGEGVPAGTYKVWLAGTERNEKVYDKNGEPTVGMVSFPQVTDDFTSVASILSLEVKGTMTYDVVVKRHPDWDKHHPHWDKRKDK